MKERILTLQGLNKFAIKYSSTNPPTGRQVCYLYGVKARKSIWDSNPEFTNIFIAGENRGEAVFIFK